MIFLCRREVWTVEKFPNFDLHTFRLLLKKNTTALVYTLGYLQQLAMDSLK